MITQANILAGGNASRMGRTDLPKSLLPLAIDGKPIIGLILDLLLKSHITDVIVTVPSAAINDGWSKLIKNYVSNNYKNQFLKITFVEAGLNIRDSIIKTKSIYHDNFLLIAGDIFTDADLTKLNTIHFQNNIFSIITVYKEGQDIKQYGIVVKNQDKINFVPKNLHTHQKGLIDAAIYAISKEFVNLLEKNEIYYQAITEATNSGKTGIYEHLGYHYDINTNKEYIKACKYIKQLKIK